ncbi:hypothetical protein BC827DRAFT_1386157 [Russula dissimulans]|nr:hypothetical protein BC827DRAFT_1386157 [Russula dissimulans]
MVVLSLLLLFFPSIIAEQKWCGKVYTKGKPVVPPDGQFPLLVSLPSPQLSLRCNPGQIPFLPDDHLDPSSSSNCVILVDALVRGSNVTGAQPVIIPSPEDAELFVSVSLDGEPLTSGKVPLNGSAAIPFSLSELSPRLAPYTLTCDAILSSPYQTFTSIPTNLTYLPSPPASIGSVTKLDLRTGSLLAKRAHSQEPYTPIFPVGFYTNFGGYLKDNDTILEGLKGQGFNMVHPIPTYENWTAFNRMVDKMEELGLWLMYDMRWDYQNLTAVTEQVLHFRNRTNLLLYYTADEPDGYGDPHFAPGLAAAHISSLDPYRPSSLVFNCQDYFFADYAAGTPVLMQDTYPIGINATYSVVWDTPCTPIQGACGCDNCVGNFEDIRNRMIDFATRLEVLGWERSKTVWTVPQGFGAAEHWSRKPTGAEFLVQTIVAVNSGARGSVSWTDPTTLDIKANASAFALALPELTPFLLSSPLTRPPVHFTHVVTPNRLDFGVWVSPEEGKTLVLGANLNYFAVNITLREVFSGSAGTSLASASGGEEMLAVQYPNLNHFSIDVVLGEVFLGSGAKFLASAGNRTRMVMDGGGRIRGSQFVFGAVQSGAWILFG